jgi:DNA-binding MarR family transcriptional regulator
MKKHTNSFDNEDAQTELWSNVGTFVQRFIKVSRINAKKSGLTLTRAWILQVIYQRGEMTPSELSIYTGTAPPTITDIVEGLAKTHCILKSRRAEDERKLTISLSETGSQKLRKFMSLQQKFVESVELATDAEFLGKLSEVFRILVRVTEALE